MAKPRMSMSARIAEQTLDSSRVPDAPSVTIPATVSRIIPSPRPKHPEKAQILLDGPYGRYRNLRIENALVDENGADVHLKKGGHVEVTVTKDNSSSKP
jgi:hypothetical protein